MKEARLEGLDLARYLALVGMVAVNFRIAMGAQDDSGFAGRIVGLLEGRAAATFVVLSGIGLGLFARRHALRARPLIVRRAAFLLALGLANSWIFPPDIIHYYAFYFLFGAFLLTLGTGALIAAVAALNVAFLALVSALDYDAGWDWPNLAYTDFWTPEGFVRNLLFNGWHPVIPWLGFLLCAIALSRVDLRERSNQAKLAVWGAAALALAEGIRLVAAPALATVDPELAVLVGTESIPPMPLYSLAGIGAASLVIGICLLASGQAKRLGILRVLAPAGRQTLTLYIAHIILGMGALESLGLLGGQSASAALAAAAIFIAAATAFAFFWSRRFGSGPLESLMRKVAG